MTKNKKEPINNSTLPTDEERFRKFIFVVEIDGFNVPQYVEKYYSETTSHIIVSSATIDYLNCTKEK